MKSKIKKPSPRTNIKARQKFKPAPEKTKTRKEKPWISPQTRLKKSSEIKTTKPTTTKTKTKTKTKKSISTIHTARWRDAHGRFASPVKYDGSHYRDKSGRIRNFATRAQRPSRAIQKPTKKAAKPTKKAAKPRTLPVKVKVRKKPAKPLKAQPKKPQRPIKAKPKKPVKPKKKPIPPAPKVPLPQLFGKDRHEILVPIRGEIKKRVQEAEALIGQVLRRGKKATSLSEIGYEYYELIAAIEKMSSHDIYTLFMSP